MNRSRIENVNFYSDILAKEMPMQVYLPESYEIEESLPVLYLLHGRSGDESMITQIGIREIADRMIKNGQIKPMIIVCPRMENSRGVNSSKSCIRVCCPRGIVVNRGSYEDYFIKELIPFVEEKFKATSTKSGRFIGGGSAGGYAALHNAFRHQHMFSKVGGHMPVLEFELEEDDKVYYERAEDWEKYSPINIARDGKVACGIKVYLDAGDRDEGGFYRGCEVLHDILKENGVECQNHVFSGNHSIQYIASNIEKYLKFYGC